jgi:hypothetical protein
MGYPSKIKLLHPEIIIQDPQTSSLRDAEVSRTLDEMNSFSLSIEAMGAARSVVRGRRARFSLG